MAAQATPSLLLLLAGLGAACRRAPPPIAIHASICGALCGDPARAADDFTGLDCALAARIRVLDATTAEMRPLGQPRCVHFDGGSTNRLVDLFSTSVPGVPGGGVDIAVDPSARVVVEVALYAPSGTPCADNAPLLALGRSAVFDVAARAGGRVEVPLGCRSLCGGRSGINVQFATLEEDLDIDIKTLPADIKLGEIYSYQPMLSTAGACAASSLTFPGGEFRPFNFERRGNFFAAHFDFDEADGAGCVAARVAFPEGVVYACLVESGGADARAWLPSRAHLAALVPNATGERGMLVVSARKYPSYDPTADAYLNFNNSRDGGGVSGEYADDPSWAQLAGGGTRDTGLAVMRNAPTGRYTVTFKRPDASIIGIKTFNAGGANEPGSITTAFAVAPAAP